MKLGNTTFDPIFKNNNTLIKLIYANLAVFIGIKLLYLIFWLMQSGSSPEQWASNWLATPASLGVLVLKPWTVFTYMFLHFDFFGHLFFNMLVLFSLGQLFIQFIGERKLWTLYVSGGIAGAVLYIVFFNLFPVFREIAPFSRALGASASVMAIVAAIGTHSPNFNIRLFLLGDVKLKYIAIVFFIIDVLSISDSNSGGHIAHIGGAVWGFLFAQQLQKGKDITNWVGIATDFTLAIFKPSSKAKMKVKYKRSNNDYDYNARKKEEQAVVDGILDKISRSGYDSLSKKEKEILFKASGKS